MKRRVSVIFIVLILMTIFSSTVLAAPAQESKSVTFVNIEYQQGGIVLLFHTSGLTKSDLNNNSFFAHSNNQNMNCNFIDDSTDVRCVVSKGLAQDEGEGFHGTLAGIGFWGEFPTNSYCPDGEIPWVNIDMFVDGKLADAGEAPLEVWYDVTAAGYFEIWTQYGITYKITGRFCSSGYYGPV